VHWPIKSCHLLRVGPLEVVICCALAHWKLSSLVHWPIRSCHLLRVGLFEIVISCALVCSFISSITILGTPGEIYSFGTIYIWRILPLPLGIWIAVKVYLPVFLKLGITSIYEVCFVMLCFSYPWYTHGILINVSVTLIGCFLTSCIDIK